MANENAVADELLDQVLPVSQLLKKVSKESLTKAWIAGDVEFGQREHVLTGKPGTKSENVGSVCIVESGTNWSGHKKARHKPLTDLLAEEPPKCHEYRTYAADGEGGNKLVPITEAAAHKMLEVVVRLTDKGLTALQA